MRFSLIATLALAGFAFAQQGGQNGDKKIPVGGQCKKDGSMGNCENGFCLQMPNEPVGECKPANGGN